MIIMLCFLGTRAFTQNIDSLTKYYRAKADKYLVKHKYVNNFFEIDWVGVHIYANPRAKQRKQAEFTVHWDDLEHFKRLIKYADRSYQLEVYQSKGVQRFSPQLLNIISILEKNHHELPIEEDKPLAGIKIAIDPGHIAGTWEVAVAESRFIEMYGIKKDPIRFFEGELTLTTALVLQDSLERLGATVMLSRDKADYSALGMSFDEWMHTELIDTLLRIGYTLEQTERKIRNTSKRRLYERYFLDEDLDARAEKINYFKPHFTVVIHFNADVNNIGWHTPTQKNYSMVFVPGSYLANELSTSTERFDFIRTLLTDHMQESTLLSQFVQNEFETQLKVPAVSDYRAPKYISQFSKKVTKGVYARNLRLCRLLNTPVCYGESLLQDNKQEVLALSVNDFKAGIIAPRLVEVANAYLVGIKKYVALLKHRQQYKKSP
ncbi:MAG: N-acetylmuramoyl-L-alanine amidase [Flammeovirgaceae bacterium]